MSADPIEVTVPIPGRPYPVWVGPGLLERAAALLALPEDAERIAVVTDARVAALHLGRLRAGLAAAPAATAELVLEGGEEAKTMASAEAVLRWLAASGVHRRDLVVALGGGVVGDLAGFAAATYARGIALVQVPTTVVAQIDAAVGGKTGVNLPEGKNLVGAFHQPRAVLADTEALATLPEAEFRAGMAEVAKHGFIDDPGILDALETERATLAGRDPAGLAPLIARAVGVKARIVARDETEQGERAHLNYGHTLGHALEAVGGYTRWRHGEAVGIGMMFAAHLGARLGLADLVAEHRRALEGLGLPVGGAGCAYEDVAGAWARDKKYRRGMRFVVLEDLGRPRLVGDVPEADLRAAYEAVR